MQVLKKIKQSSNNESESLRASFKESLGKLTLISTRDRAFKELKTLILQNKTTTNLRIWLSVLTENRTKHHQSEIYIIGFIIEQYGTRLLDPLDKIPSLEKTAFRITELIMKSFQDSQMPLQLACQKTWVQIYLSCMFSESIETKKKVLFNNLEALINGGGGKVSQTTAQFVIDGLLEASLNKEDHEFFKQIAKRTLVLFLKTTIIHFSTLTCLQTILSFFGINNLIPLLDNICTKIISYIDQAPANSLGYKIKAECCNALNLIGEQIDKNGLSIWVKVSKVLEDQATNKVWAVQATGRKALATWRDKKAEWEKEFLDKQERFGQQQSQRQGGGHVQFYQGDERAYQNKRSQQENLESQKPLKPYNSSTPDNQVGININDLASSHQHNNWINQQNLGNQFPHQNNHMRVNSNQQSQDGSKIPLVLETDSRISPNSYHPNKELINANGKSSIQQQLSSNKRPQPPANTKNAKNLNEVVPNTYHEGFFNPSANYYNPTAKYLQKNSGVGGGNNIQTAENFYQRKQKDNQQQSETYAKKMEEIKKSIYMPQQQHSHRNAQNGEWGQFDETVPWDQAKSLPDFKAFQQSRGAHSEDNKFGGTNFERHPKSHMQKQRSVVEGNFESNPGNPDVQFVEEWEAIVEIYDRGEKEKAVKQLLEMDDDIYFLRFLLQNGNGLLKDLTRVTSSKMLRKILSIQKTNFMEQMLFKMVAQTSKIKAGQLLSNSQNLQVMKNLDKCQKVPGLERVSEKLKSQYENSLST